MNQAITQVLESQADDRQRVQGGAEERLHDAHVRPGGGHVDALALVVAETRIQQSTVGNLQMITISLVFEYKQHTKVYVACINTQVNVRGQQQ